MRPPFIRPPVRRLLASGVLVIFCAANLCGADVVFQDGEVAKGVKIVSQTETHVTIIMPAGMIKFPHAAIKTIDGKPPGASPVPPSAPVQAPAPAPPPEMQAAAEPSLPENSTESVPEPVVTETTIPAPLKTADSQPASRTWNWEIFFVAYLAIAAVWMRSLQWVQKDLFERRADPRAWSMAALFLPGLGALIYFLSVKVGEMLSARRRQTKKASKPRPEDETPKEKSSWMMSAPDPAAFLAAKGRTRRGFEFLDTERQSIAISGDGELSSGLDNAQEMLEEALLEHASDIHIEPTSEDYRVRFRLDGILHERMTYLSTDGKRIVTALKAMAEIDIAEKRKAQDGRFRARLGEHEVDFRVATTSSLHGEKMVIRILDHQRGVFDLTSLGMSAEMLESFRNVIHSRNGMILVTGPTGSGKTSTLYAALRQLDLKRLNVMTIEDPPEYELDGATQTAVNNKAGVTYESGLRSILRQDPDVIFVGEMRDTEAAQVALRAALTGHLLLSSLHTKDAVGTVTRLQDMGIERYQLASALLMVIAQRLVRVLCPHCRQPHPARGDELESIGLSFTPGDTIYTAAGCEQCLGTGFKGRTGIFELLIFDDAMRKAVGEGSDESSFAEMAAAQGFRSYRYDGAEKILQGVTTVEEVLQAV